MGLVGFDESTSGKDLLIVPTTRAKTRPGTKKTAMSKGAWTPEEDQKLTETIAIHGAQRWKKVAISAGLNRCGKSCRLRWMNYLRPNIKRGNISAQEEDLILRLHKLLGNRWSLIAGRLPGRTDNEIKNYWNSHLSKKMKDSNRASERRISSEHPVNEQQQITTCAMKIMMNQNKNAGIEDHEAINLIPSNNKTDNSLIFKNSNEFDFLNEGLLDVDWISSFLEVDGCS